MKIRHSRASTRNARENIKLHHILACSLLLQLYILTYIFFPENERNISRVNLRPFRVTYYFTIIKAEKL